MPTNEPSLAAQDSAARLDVLSENRTLIGPVPGSAIGTSPILPDAALSQLPLTSSALAAPSQPLSRSAGGTASGGPGPNEIATRERDAQASVKQAVSAYESLTTLAGKTYARWATDKGRTAAALDKAFRDVLVETVTEEAKGLVGGIPYGKALMLTLELSNAFAAGVGEAMLEAQAKAREGSNQPRSIEEEVLYERQYQARAVAALPDVLLRGVNAVAAKAIEIIFEKIGQALQAAVKDVAGQIAKQLPKHCDLLGILNATAADLSGRIPPGRAGVERVTFHFVSSIFVREYAGDDVAKRLAPIVGGLKGKESVDIGLLGGLIQVLAAGSYRTYSKFVPVDKAVDILRGDLIDNARELILRTSDAGFTVEKGPTTVLADDRIVLSDGLYTDLTAGAGEMGQAEFSRLMQRVAEFSALKARLNKELRDIAQLYQRRIDRLPENSRDDEALRLQNGLADLSSKGFQTLLKAIEAVVAEFGEYANGYYPRTLLTMGGDKQQHMLPVPRLTW